MLPSPYRQEPPPIAPALVTCPICETVHEVWPCSQRVLRRDWCDACVKQYWDDWTPTPAEYI